MNGSEKRIGSSIYETVKNQVSISEGHQPKQERLIELISSLCKSYQYTSGYRKITALLQKEMKMNHKTVQLIIQPYGLQYRVRKLNSPFNPITLQKTLKTSFLPQSHLKNW